MNLRGLHARRATVLAGGVLALGLLAACDVPPYPRGSVDKLFANGTAPLFESVAVAGRILNLARMSTPAVDSTAAPAKPGPVLLFVHGSPGDWKAWSYFLQSPALAGYASRLAVDRPGFGGSDPGQVVPDLRQQAALLTALIPAGKKAIVIGHSLGGPIAAWMALDAPDRVCGVVSIAGSLSSVYEAPRWYNLLADSPLVRWAVPAEMVWSNHEMMSLSTELAKLEAALGGLQVPLTVMQGGKDSLVDPRTADEVEKHAPKGWTTIQRLPLETHFVLWEKPQLVIDAIRQQPCV